MAPRVDRAIRLSTVVAVLAVACIAAYVSYWHAYAVVCAHGESGVTARLEPATIDGLVYASSMVNLYAARHGLPVPTLARWLLGLGIAATLAANMAQGWSHGLTGAVVAAWPAVSLVRSYELLVWIIRTAAADGLAREPSKDHAVARADQGSGPGWDAADRAYQEGDHIRTDAGMAGKASGENETNAAAVAAYRLSVEGCKPLSERRLAGMFGKTSRRWARNRIAEARQVPIPAQYGSRTWCCELGGWCLGVVDVILLPDVRV